MVQNIVRNYEYTTASAEVSASYDLLIANKEFIQNETIEFVSSSWSGFDYPELTCKRDVGYIVDAVATDLLYGGNERTITAGKYYYDYPSAAIVGGVPSVSQQKDPTVTAINYVKGLSTELVGGNIFVTSSNEIDFVYDSVKLNRGFIQNETVAFVNAKYPNLQYNEVSCSRDTGFIVDAVITDLKYGGNQRTLTAGEFYYRFPSKATNVQLGETTDAVTYISDLVNEIVLQNTLTIPTLTKNTENVIKTTSVTQTLGSGTTEVSVLNAVNSSFDIVMDIVKQGTGSYTPTTATYNPADGEFVMTVANHGLEKSNGIYLRPESFVFTCDMDGNKTEHKLPSVGQPAYSSRLNINSVTDNTISVNVGVSGPNVQFTPSDVTYDPSTGDLVLTIGTHTLSNGEGIIISANSLAFTCDMDGNQSVKSYPRAGIDPYAGRSMKITNVTSNTITINAGVSGPNKYFTPTDVDYNALSGDMVVTVGQHGLGVNRSVVLENESFAFTCDMDGNSTTHSYPRVGSDTYAGK